MDSKTIPITEIIQDILSAYRVRSIRLTGMSPNLNELDFHLREHLYESYDYRSLFLHMTEKVTMLAPVEYMDDFGLRYLVISGACIDGQQSFCVCGPFQYEAPTGREFSLLIYK